MTKPELNAVKEIAEDARYLYIIGKITRKEALAKITPFINAFNEKSKTIAKKYNQRAKTISFATYVR